MGDAIYAPQCQLYVARERSSLPELQASHDSVVGGLSGFYEPDPGGRFGHVGIIAGLSAVALGAAIIAERIRDGVHKIPVTLANETVNVSISIGISQADESDESYKDVINRADAALYQAKDRGKNRVEIN